jgi:hypothetical protein
MGADMKPRDIYDLSLVKPLRSFYIAREFSTFSAVDAMNFCKCIAPPSSLRRRLAVNDSTTIGVRVVDDGNVVSVCTDAGAHGTHVAGIVGAFDKNDSNNCGVAPGVQIISLKIGDSRLGPCHSHHSRNKLILAQDPWRLELVCAELSSKHRDTM